MCGMIKLTSVSTVWWKEAEKRWFLDNCRVKMEEMAVTSSSLEFRGAWMEVFPFMLLQLYFVFCTFTQLNMANPLTVKIIHVKNYNNVCKKALQANQCHINCIFTLIHISIYTYSAFLLLWPLTFFQWRLNWRLNMRMWLLHSERTHRATLMLWESRLMYKHHECCSVVGRKPRQALAYVSYNKRADHTPLSHTRMFRQTHLQFTAFNQVLSHGFD